jgi:hypothetical protein
MKALDDILYGNPDDDPKDYSGNIPEENLCQMTTQMTTMITIHIPNQVTIRMTIQMTTEMKTQ